MITPWYAKQFSKTDKLPSLIITWNLETFINILNTIPHPHWF